MKYVLTKEILIDRYLSKSGTLNSSSYHVLFKFSDSFRAKDKIQKHGISKITFDSFF